MMEYMREVQAEMKKVIWPSRRETAVFTLVVLLSVGLVALILWIMDLAFSQLLRLFLRG
jgi:preprotein translocase subunit SecE